MYENTEFTLSRDCEAIQIPSGQKTTIPAGTPGVITQSLEEATRLQLTRAWRAWRRKTSTRWGCKNYNPSKLKKFAGQRVTFQRKRFGTNFGNVMTRKYRSISSILVS